MKEFYFTDNWYGNLKKYRTLSAAIKEARKQSGNSISIFEKKNNQTRIVEIIECTGINPS